MVNDEVQRVLRASQRRGWLLVEGRLGEERWSQLPWQWAGHCSEQQMDSYEVYRTPDQVWVGVHLRQLPSSIGYRELEAWLQQHGFSGEAEWGLRFEAPGGTDPAPLIQELRELVARDRTEARALELQAERPSLAGWALAVRPETVWEDLEAHHLVYVHAIPEQPGRCLALAHRQLPVLDLQLWDFRLLDPRDT